MIELLVVMVVIAILMSFGFNTYSKSKIRTQIKLEQQYLLQIPGLIESYFSDNLSYPDNLNGLLTAENGEFFTPKNLYLISYSLNQDNSYSVFAESNPDAPYSDSIECPRLVVDSSGELRAYDNDDNDISSKCWD